MLRRPARRYKIPACPDTLPPVFEGGPTKLTQLRQEFSRLGFPTSSLDGPNIEYSRSLLAAKSPLQSVSGLEEVMGLFSATGVRKAEPSSDGEQGISASEQKKGLKGTNQHHMVKAVKCVTCDAVFQDMMSQIFDKDRNAMMEDPENVCQVHVVPKVLKNYSVQKGNSATGFVLQDREGHRVGKEEAQAVMQACRNIMEQSGKSPEGGAHIDVLQKHMHDRTPSDRFASTLERRACQDIKACPSTPDELVLEEFSSDCLEVVQGWWSYEICPHKHVMQLHRDKDDKVGARINLGKWTGSSTEVSHTLAKHLRAPGRKATVQALSQAYEGGTMCEVKHAAGPTRPVGGLEKIRRSSQVRYACSPTEKVYATVEERETCSYDIDIYHPSLCHMHNFGLD